MLTLPAELFPLMVEVRTGKSNWVNPTRGWKHLQNSQPLILDMTDPRDVL